MQSTCRPTVYTEGPVPLYVETERNRAKPSYHVETGSIGGDVIEIYTPY